MLSLHYKHIFNLRILLEWDVTLERKMIKNYILSTYSGKFSLISVSYKETVSDLIATRTLVIVHDHISSIYGTCRDQERYKRYVL